MYHTKLPMKKRCNKCSKRRPLKFFYRHPQMKDGHLNHCVTCHGKAGRANYRKNIDRWREYSRNYQRSWRKNPGNKKKAKEYKDKYRKAHPERVQELRRRKVIRSYGLTLEEYDAMVRRQRNRCKSCGGPPDGRWKKLHIDHCHKTGRVRGLLCGKCNCAAGYLKDDPKRALALSRYLAAA
jgi:hypothetical protein